MNAPETIAAALTLATLPALGADLEGGLFAGLTTDKQGRHFAVVLMPDKPAGQLTWKQALAWADSVGGVLPTRPVSAMLLANCKAQFEEAWHWTSEEYGGSCAWYQSFDYGSQLCLHKFSELQARAVRLIQLNA